MQKAFEAKQHKGSRGFIKNLHDSDFRSLMLPEVMPSEVEPELVKTSGDSVMLAGPWIVGWRKFAARTGFHGWPLMSFGGFVYAPFKAVSLSVVSVPKLLAECQLETLNDLDKALDDRKVGKVLSTLFDIVVIEEKQVAWIPYGCTCIPTGLHDTNFLFWMPWPNTKLSQNIPSAAHEICMSSIRRNLFKEAEKEPTKWRDIQSQFEAFIKL